MASSPDTTTVNQYLEESGFKVIYKPKKAMSYTFKLPNGMFRKGDVPKSKMTSLNLTAVYQGASELICCFEPSDKTYSFFGTVMWSVEMRLSDFEEHGDSQMKTLFNLAAKWKTDGLVRKQQAIEKIQEDKDHAGKDLVKTYESIEGVGAFA